MKLRILSITTICLAIVGCNNNLDNLDNKNKQIDIVHNINSFENYTGEVNIEQNETTIGKMTIAETKLNSDRTQFEVNDAIGLYAVEWEGNKDAQTIGTMVARGNVVDNHLYTLQTNIWSTNTLANPLTERKVSVFAYYPYDASMTNALEYPVTFEKTQTSNRSSYYLMRATAPNNYIGYEPLVDETPIKLGFEHLMAEVNITVTLPNTYLNETINTIVGAKVVNNPNTGKLNLATGVLTTSEEKSNTTMTGVSVNPKHATFKAVVPPTIYKAGETMFSITYRISTGYERQLNLNAPTNGFSFEKSKKYNITMTTAYEFNFVNNGTSVNGSIIPKTQTNRYFSIKSTDPDLRWRVECDSDLAEFALIGSGATSTYFEGTGDATNLQITFNANTTGEKRRGCLRLIDLTEGTTRLPIELIIYQRN